MKSFLMQSECNAILPTLHFFSFTLLAKASSTLSENQLNQNKTKYQIPNQRQSPTFFIAATESKPASDSDEAPAKAQPTSVNTLPSWSRARARL
jgi:hypothetical protein